MTEKMTALETRVLTVLAKADPNYTIEQFEALKGAVGVHAETGDLVMLDETRIASVAPKLYRAITKPLGANASDADKNLRAKNNEVALRSQRGERMTSTAAPDAHACRLAIAALPPVKLHWSDAQKAERSIQIERIYREHGFGDSLMRRR